MSVPMFLTVIVYRSVSPASSTFGLPVRSVEIFSTWKAGADSIRTRVGSSSPGSSGFEIPLTFGSSLRPTTTPSPRSLAWFVTSLPLVIDAASLTS
jgi:hypothetical protein